MALAVLVVYAQAACEVREIALQLPEGATVADALLASGLATSYPGLDLANAAVGIWGRQVSRQQVLRAQDRVEVYRALRIDPKVARRERFARQGARTTGLFAKRRPGAKPGY